MSFSKDFGFEPVDEIQLTTLDSRTRNRLYNTFSDVMDCSNEADEIYAILADKLGYIKGYYNRQNVMDRFIGSSKDSKWYDPYDILTYFFEIINLMDPPTFVNYFNRTPFFTKDQFIDFY